MAIWECPNCEGVEIQTYEWEARRVPYVLDAPFEEGWDVGESEAPGHEPNILMAACCRECTYELTYDELVLLEKSIGGLVLSAHPNTPINPLKKQVGGYVIVNPVHYCGTPVVLGWDETYAWPNYEDQLREMFEWATENDNEHLYVGIVIPITFFKEIADRYKLCEECGEIYDPTDEKCSCEV